MKFESACELPLCSCILRSVSCHNGGLNEDENNPCSHSCLGRERCCGSRRARDAKWPAERASAQRPRHKGRAGSLDLQSLGAMLVASELLWCVRLLSAAPTFLWPAMVASTLASLVMKTISGASGPPFFDLASRRWAAE